MKYFVSSVVAAGLVAGMASSAFCDPTPFFVVQENANFTQTGASSTVAKGFEFFGTASNNDFATPFPAGEAGTLSVPSAVGTVPLAPAGVSLQFDSGSVDQTTFENEFPTGIYTFNLTGSEPANQPVNVDVNIAASSPSAIPILTASSFNALSAGIDSSQDTAVDFNAAPPGAADLIFFAIVDESSGNVLLEDGLQPDVTQDTIPANLLTPGQQYELALLYLKIATPTDGGGNELDSSAQIETVTETSAIFTTAPEPATALMSLLGMGAMCGFSRRRR